MLPENQAAMLSRAEAVHGHATRSAVTGIALTSRDHRSVGYRVPKEWLCLTEAQRGLRTIGAFKRGSRAGFLAGYAAFECANGGCGVCGW